MNILFINACIRGREISRTDRISRVFLEELQKNDSVCIEEVDLLDCRLVPLGKESLAYRDDRVSNNDFTSPLFDYAKQFSQADRIVIAAPFWDLNFPAILKIYFEAICVGNLTFQYTAEGSEGLCKAEKLMYITTRGGDFTVSPAKETEHAVNYVRDLSAMLGIEKVDAISADGLDIVGNHVEAIIERAEEEARQKASEFLK